MANTKVTQHVIANNAITADQIASAAVTDAKLHSTLDLSGKTLTLPATTIPSASTATTQAASDNTTKLATTAYVTTAIANLNDSAPTALNTLNELAAALGDDANFSGTITTSLAGKLPLAGGTLTGALTLSGAPTSALHAATKTYVDTADALKLNLSGGTLTGDLILNTTGALKIPVGTTGQRPTAATGQIRWNSTDGAIEVYNGTAWTAVGTGSSNKLLDTFTGDGSNATFTLSVTPANEDAIMVFIDGAYQEKSDYVLTNNSLVLDTAPLLNEKIAVHITTASVHDGTTAVNQQFTATAGQTDFTLSQDPKSENNTQVYINGVYQQKTDYTVTGTTLAFDTGLTVGDVVEVNMFTVATLGNTDTVNEGVSNLYHTTARARGAISVSGNALSYNSSTGVLTSTYEESPTFTGTISSGAITSSASITASGNSNNFGNTTISNLSATTVATSGSITASGNSNSFGNTTLGTTSSGPLTVNTDANSSLLIKDAGTNAIQVVANTGDELYIGGNNSYAIRFLNDGSNNVVFDNSSNLGIGTSSPQTKLHVYGNDPVIRVSDDGTSGFSTLELRQQNTTNEGFEISYNSGTGHTHLNNVYSSGDMVFGTSTGSFGTTSTNVRMTIKSNGHVSIPSQPHWFGSATNTSGSGLANAQTPHSSLSRNTINISTISGALRWIIPRTGVYVISFNTIADSGSTRVDTSIRINGNVISSQLNATNTSGYRQRSATIIVYVQENDYVQFSHDDWYSSSSNVFEEWRTISLTMVS